MRKRLWEASEFLVLLAIAVGGLVSATTWPLIVTGAHYLWLRSFERFGALVPRARAAGAMGLLYRFLAESALNGLLAASVSFALGRFVSWLFW